MPYLSPTSFFSAVGGASAAFSNTMPEGTMWQFTSTTACWINFASTTPTAAKSNGSTYVPPNYPVLILVPPGGAKVATLQDAAGGNASLTLMNA